MDLSTHFPIWDKLTPAQQKIISQSSQSRSVPRGTVLHNGSVDCLGLLLILSGQLGPISSLMREEKSLSIVSLNEMSAFFLPPAL